MALHFHLASFPPTWIICFGISWSVVLLFIRSSLCLEYKELKNIVPTRYLKMTFYGLKLSSFVLSILAFWLLGLPLFLALTVSDVPCCVFFASCAWGLLGFLNLRVNSFHEFWKASGNPSHIPFGTPLTHELEAIPWLPHALGSPVLSW